MANPRQRPKPPPARSRLEYVLRINGGPELQDLADRAGVSRTGLTFIVGGATPTADQRERIARALGVPAGQLFGAEPEPGQWRSPLDRHMQTHGIKQSFLVEKTGIQQSRISRIQARGFRPSAREQKLIATALGRPVGELFPPIDEGVWTT